MFDKIFKIDFLENESLYAEIYFIFLINFCVKNHPFSVESQITLHSIKCRIIYNLTCIENIDIL